MRTIEECLAHAPKRIMLCGHKHPDGDCVGAVMGLYHYLNENSSCTVVPYLETPIESLQFLTEGFPFRSDDGNGEQFDLAIALDASDIERITAGLAAFQQAVEKIVIDHHETNTLFGDRNHVVPDASSTCEVLTALMQEEKIGTDAAAALFTGIVCDSGVFRYDSTTPETLRTAARLIGKGIPFSWIIEHTNVERKYDELKIASAIIHDSVFLPEERFAYAVADRDIQEKYGVFSKDLGNVVTDLNSIADTDAVLFIYWNGERYKGSLRSKSAIDVAAIAASLGGGGHIRAAGFDSDLAPEEIVRAVLEKIRAQREERKA